MFLFLFVCLFFPSIPIWVWISLKGYPDGLWVRNMLEIDGLFNLHCLGQKKPFWNVFDGLISKSRLQTFVDGKSVKEVSWGKKAKMVTEKWQISDFFLPNESWYTNIYSPRFCKWPWILNWSKWILLVDIPTQILFTIIGSIDYSSRCKLDIYVIAHTKEKPCTIKWYLSQNL